MHAYYLAFFDCFNQQQFFEAHEVLEKLWLSERGRPSGLFYQGLIQLAGAFVHVQKERPGPAVALFRPARAKLQSDPVGYEQLDSAGAMALIEHWLALVEHLPAPDAARELKRTPPLLRLKRASDPA